MNSRHLIAGLAPLLLILVVAGLIYLPGVFIHPTLDFVYYGYDESSGYSEYSNDAPHERLGNLASFTEEDFLAIENEGTLYLHDVESNTSTELDFESFKELSLDPSEISSEGFSFRYLWDKKIWLMEGRGVRKEMDIIPQSNSLFVLVGWLNP